MTSTLAPGHYSAAPASGAASASTSASYLVGLEQSAQTRNGEPAWLAERRHQATEAFRSTGFPTGRDEDWRFTNVAPIAQRQFRRAGAPLRVAAEQLDPYVLGSPVGSRIVFLNGRFAPTWSSITRLPKGVKLGSLHRALAVDAVPLERFLGRYAGVERRPFAALNQALFQDGACLYVPPGVVLEAPIHLLFLTDAAAGAGVISPRNLLILDRGARASVIETYASLADGDCFTNAVTEMVVRAGASAEHIKLQLDSERAFHIGSTQVHQEQESRLRSFSITFGGALARNDLDVVLAGSDSECQLDGLYMARGRQLVDNHTSIRHLHPRCASREVYKGIIAGSAHAVFNGKVYVAPEAQKTDGKQTNRNLLLSDDAKVDTKPQLEIFADDVKCTHGATVGRLDEMGLFYLRSRGLPEPAARKILTYAFAAEILEGLPLAELRQRLEGLVMSRLDGERE